MKAQEFYNSIHSLKYEANCTSIDEWRWNELMTDAKRADVYKVNRLVKNLLPGLFHILALDEKPLKDLGWYNPYPYYRTDTHLILVHSMIEYFLKIT